MGRTDSGGEERTAQRRWRVRTCTLGAGTLEIEAGWIERYRRTWEARFDALDGVIEDLKREEDGHGG